MKKVRPSGIFKNFRKKNFVKRRSWIYYQCFYGAFEELGKLIDGDDEKLNEQYKWLSEKKRKELFSLVDTLVSDCD